MNITREYLLEQKAALERDKAELGIRRKRLKELLRALRQRYGVRTVSEAQILLRTMHQKALSLEGSINVGVQKWKRF